MSNTKHLFAKHVFCISGTLSIVRREMRDLIEKHGGRFATSVTKNVTHLITTKEEFENDDLTTKIRKATDEGIPIITEDFIHDSIKREKLQDDSDYLLNDKASLKSKDSGDHEDDDKTQFFAGEVFALSGRFTERQKNLEELILDHGGEVKHSVTQDCTYLITTNREWGELTEKVKDARKHRLHIVNEQFLHDCVEKDALQDFNNYRLRVEEEHGTKRKADDDGDGHANKKVKSTA